LGIKISNKSAYFLIILSNVVILIGCLFRITHWLGADSLLLFGLILQFFICIFLIVDIIKSNIRNRGFWILYMMIFAPVTQLIYVFRKNTLSKN
jgi:hypothetical protein